MLGATRIQARRSRALAQPLWGLSIDFGGATPVGSGAAATPWLISPLPGEGIADGAPHAVRKHANAEVRSVPELGHDVLQFGFDLGHRGGGVDLTGEDLVQAGVVGNRSRVVEVAGD